MNQRIYQVCLTYVLRWPLWLVAVAYLVVCGIAFYFAWFTNWPSPVRNVFPELPQPQPTVNLTERTEQERIEHDTRSLFWNGAHLAPLNTVVSEPFPKLTSFQIVGELAPTEDLLALRRMPNLEAFALLGDAPANGLNSLAELPRLRYLRLLEIPAQAGLEPLRNLTQLQTLDVMRVPDYARFLEEIRQLPHLRTLILPGQVVAVFKASDWDRLRSMPGLERIYLRGKITAPDSSRIELDRVQQILPHVKVRPAEISEQRSNTWCFVAFASVLIWGVLTIQLQSQFSSCGSLLIPHFADCHLRVVATLWAVTTTAHTVILCLGDCSFAASLAGSLVMPGVYWGINAALLQSSRKENQAGALNPFFSTFTCLYTFPIMGMLSRYFLSDLDWFLEGRQPALAWGITVASLITPTIALLRIPRLHAIHQESPLGTPPLGASPKEWKIWTKKMALLQTNPRKSWWRVDQGARLDAAVAAPGPRNWSRLWNAAHIVDVPQLTIRMMIITAIYLAIFQCVAWLQLIDVGSQVQLFPFAMMMGGMWIEGTFVGLVMIWRNRRETLSLELLRPATRQEFVQRLFAAVRRDLRSVLAAQLVAAVVLLGIYGTHNLPPLFIPSVICYCIFRGLSSYFAILFFLAIRRTWVVFGIIAVIWFPAFAADGYWAVTSMRPEGWFPEVVMTLCIAGSVASGLGIIWLKRHWQRIELA